MQTRLSCIRDLEKESRHKKAQAVQQKKADPEERLDFRSTIVSDFVNLTPLADRGGGRYRHVLAPKSEVGPHVLKILDPPCAADTSHSSVPYTFCATYVSNEFYFLSASCSLRFQ